MIKRIIALIICVLCVFSAGCNAPSDQSVSEPKSEGEALLTEYLDQTYSEYSIKSIDPYCDSNTTKKLSKAVVEVYNQEYIYYADTETQKIYTNKDVEKYKETLLKCIIQKDNIPTPYYWNIVCHNYEIGLDDFLDIDKKQLPPIGEAYQCEMEFFFGEEQEVAPETVKTDLSLEGNYTLLFQERKDLADDGYESVTWTYKVEQNNEEQSETFTERQDIKINGLKFITNAPIKQMEVQEIDVKETDKPVLPETHLYNRLSFTPVEKYKIIIETDKEAIAENTNSYPLYVVFDDAYASYYANFENTKEIDVVDPLNNPLCFYISALKDEEYILCLYKE